ncbi:MAG: hypothetical protein IKV03_03900 [Alphaproteobacteria bacterium]|nr:hypothetical protein [Alphaproteobacteria bacterium]
MINPKDLPLEQTNCPLDCPFLSGRHFLPDILPYFCDCFDVFLGVDAGERTARCFLCRLQPENIVEEGLSLISAYTLTHLSISDTKEAFLQLSPFFQRMFVEVVKKTGRQVAIAYGEQVSADTLMAETLKEYKQAKDWLGSPELKEFKGILTGLGDFSPQLLTRQTKSLLENLFQVLDKSERAMLKNLMSSKGNAQALLEQFKAIPKDMSLLKNFRHMLYEHDDREKLRRLEQERRRQMERLNRVKQNTVGRGGR